MSSVCRPGLYTLGRPVSMKNNKFIIAGIATVVLLVAAIGVVFITRQTSGPEPLAPTAPQSRPSAGSCSLEFTVEATPGPSESPSPSPSPTPSPTPVAQCGTTCTGDTDCPTSMVCSSGVCRNPSCTESSTCVCATATPSPTPSPTPVASCNAECSTDTQCPSNLICYTGRCRMPGCTAVDSCTCGPTCNSVCTTNSDCPSDLICSSGLCRRPGCTAVDSCSCGTPGPTTAPTNPPVSQSTPPQPAAPQESLPVAGSSLPTAGLIGTGILTIIIGILGLLAL
jgi:hypothetical protein